MIRAARFPARTSGSNGPGAPAEALPTSRGRHLCLRIGHTIYRPIKFRHAPGARAFAMRALLRARLPEAIGALLIPAELPEHYWSPHLAGAIGAAVRRAMVGEV